MSLTEEAAFRVKKRNDGLENLKFIDRYKIGTSELFEFTATKNGRQIKGAGDTNSEVSYDQDDPRFNLPSIYFLLGQTCINSIR